MKDCNEFIESGILELYVLGDTTPEEDAAVEEMSRLYPRVQTEIAEIRLAMDNYATARGSIEPDPIIRPFLMATIDYMDRLGKGEPFTFVPAMTESSTIADYESWINREDIVAPVDYEGVYAKILSYTEELISAVVWLKEMAPQEVHDNEYERFLILEGTCVITIAEDNYPLGRGDFLQIPLHKNHYVTVTSAIPCKVLLQRVKV
jgi:mannose-6-phosphate isomerase-like protein (cupin superfamily)